MAGQGAIAPPRAMDARVPGTGGGALLSATPCSCAQACIDQESIEESLLCLPIFLAGCQRLVVVAGLTYTLRLWCMLELFVFFKMGGSLSRFTLLPISMDEGQAKAMFDAIDVAKASCYLESDRQKLLGIIEVGFGDVSAFNTVLRHVFVHGFNEGAGAKPAVLAGHECPPLVV
jgi:hypothetical protein